jgi:hypothetical protein
VLLCCGVGDDVATVVLRFEDGDDVELSAVEGFVYYAIPARHYPRGHRLEQIVGPGFERARRRAKAHSDGRARVYPCETTEELKLPYELTICP